MYVIESIMYVALFTYTIQLIIFYAIIFKGLEVWNIEFKYLKE